MCGDKGMFCQDLERGQLQLTGTLPCPPLVAAGDAVAYIMLWPMLLYALRVPGTSQPEDHPNRFHERVQPRSRVQWLTNLSCEAGADATEANVERAA